MEKRHNLTVYRVMGFMGRESRGLQLAWREGRFCKETLMHGFLWAAQGWEVAFSQETWFSELLVLWNWRFGLHEHSTVSPFTFGSPLNHTKFMANEMIKVYLCNPEPQFCMHWMVLVCTCLYAVVKDATYVIFSKKIAHSHGRKKLWLTWCVCVFSI